MCVSKALSVPFATPLIGKAHADMSSAAVEIFSLGNATIDITGLSYVVEEMGMAFPIPFTLEMDNDAARIFCLGSAHKTKLKHIDCCQEWVRCLRDRKIMTPVHADSKGNDADHSLRYCQGNHSKWPATASWWNTTFIMTSSYAAGNDPHTLKHSKPIWHDLPLHLRRRQ